MQFWSKAVVAAAIAMGLLRHFGALGGLGSDDLRTAYGVLAQIAGTMLGFVLAAIAILATIANTKLLRNMQKTGHYRHLLGRMLGVTSAFGVAMICTLASLFVAHPPEWLPYLNVGVIAAASIGLFDVCRKLWLVLTHLNPEPAP